MVSQKQINVLFLLVQAIFLSMCCMMFAFLSPILQRFGYDAWQIGTTMTFAAFSAMLAQPLWGYINDKTACSKQVVLGATIFASLVYVLLVYSNGNAVIVNVCVMCMYGTMNCMMGFIDSWTAKLIADGYDINYGATRSGGSFSYALTAALFGFALERFGFKVAPFFVAGLLVILIILVLSLPNPRMVYKSQKISPVIAFSYLFSNEIYILLLLAYFLRSFTSCASENFFSLLVTELGGTEAYVGIGLFVMAICELPFMIFYRRIKQKLGWSASVFLGVSMAFFGLKALCMGIAPSFPWLLLTVMLNGLSFAMFMPAYIDFMLENIDKRYLSTAQLLCGALGGSLGSIIGNLFDGWLANTLGLQTMLQIASLFAFVASMLILVPAFLQKRLRAHSTM